MYYVLWVHYLWLLFGSWSGKPFRLVYFTHKICISRFCKYEMKQIFLFSDSFSLLGTIYGVVGSLMLSLYSIYTKKVLPSVNQQVWLLSYYNNAYSILLFLPLIVLNGELTALWNYPNFDSTYFWFQMLVGGLCGFAIGYVTSLQIQVILLIWYFSLWILLFFKVAF